MEANDAFTLEKQRERRRRVRRMKLLMVGGGGVLLLLLILCCIFLLIKTLMMQRKIDDLSEQVQEIAMVLKEKNHLEEVAEESLLSDGSPVNDSEETGLSEPNPEPELSEEAEVIDNRQKVYLTFDDGPSDYTEVILDTLDAYGVKATFFVIGKTDEHSQEMYREIVARGHTLAMHSFSHRYSELYASTDAFVADLLKEQEYLKEVTGITPWLYRFPGGSSNHAGNARIQDLIAELNARSISYVDWNVSTGDATNSYFTESILLNNVEKDLGKYSDAVILLHDTNDKAVTRESLGKLIEVILARDAVILPITEESVLVQHVSAQ